MTRDEQKIRGILVFLACCFTVFLGWQRPELLSRFDEGVRDAFLRLSVDTTPETRLTIVDISEEAIAAIGPWPWSRGKLADLVEILFTHYRVQAVGLDVVFPEAADPSGDARLAALAAHAPLTLAQIFDYTPRNQGIALGGLIGGQPAAVAQPAVTAYGYIANHAAFNLATCAGNIGYLPDNDGVLRRIPVTTRFEGRDYGGFAAALLSCPRASGADLAALIHGAPEAQWRIPFLRAVEAYTVIPASAILLETAPVALLAGRYVLIGSSALSLGDRVSIPLAPLSAGVMVHAYSLSAMLDQLDRTDKSSPPGAYVPVLWVLCATIMAAWCLTTREVLTNLLVLPVIASTWLALTYWGVRDGVEWSVSLPLWVWFAFILAVIYLEWRASRQKAQKLIDTFSHYVAQPVLDEILRLGLSYSLKPTLCEVSVLIADMEGYTRTTSSLSLEDAAQLTKDFLDCLTRPVLQHGGTLDKYSGDGLVAFWGAPLPCPDQADRAVSAGLDILQAVARFNQSRVAQKNSPVRVRIGIESGMALVGDLGTPFRSTYTAVGDCINFASRLESAARDLPTNLVIGSAANAKLERYQTYALGNIALRGTETRIEIFSILPPSPNAAVKSLM